MFSILSQRLFATTCKASSNSPRLSQVKQRVGGFIAFGFVPVTTSLFWKTTYSSATAEMETVDSSSRLSELRKLMKERNIDIYGSSSCLHHA